MALARANAEHINDLIAAENEASSSASPSSRPPSPSQLSTLVVALSPPAETPSRGCNTTQDLHNHICDGNEGSQNVTDSERLPADGSSDADVVDMDDTETEARPDQHPGAGDAYIGCRPNHVSIMRQLDPITLVEPEPAFHASPSRSSEPAWLTSAFWAIIKCHTRHSLSQAGCETWLRSLKQTVLALGKDVYCPLRFPSLLKHLGLHELGMIRYTICPHSSCRQLSPPSPPPPPPPPQSPGTLAAIAQPSCIGCSRTLDKDRKYFEYFPLEEWIRKLVCRPEARSLLGRQTPQPPPPHTPFPDGTWPMSDVQHGGVWQDEAPFLNSGNEDDVNLLIGLTADWFHPFNYQRVQYQCAPMVISVLNLPPSLRYKPEYRFLSGVIPGPKEPSWQKCPNFLGPLVCELRRLLEGVDVTIPPPSDEDDATTCPGPAMPTTIRVRVKLALFIADSPARTKICGFNPLTVLLQVCPYCMADKEDFRRIALGKRVCRARNPEMFRRHSAAAGTRRASTQRNIAKEYGARYSALHELPYFSAVRSAPVDAMHAVLLGIVKRVWRNLLVDTELLDAESLRFVQSGIERSKLPSTVAKPHPKTGKPSGGTPTAAQFYALAMLLPAYLHELWAESIEEYLADRKGITRIIETRSDISEEAKDSVDWFWLDQGEKARRSKDVPTPPKPRWIHLGWVFVEIVERLSVVVAYVNHPVLTHHDVDVLDREMQDLNKHLAMAMQPFYNNHILSHIRKQLLLFGPPRVTWAFATEKDVQRAMRAAVSTNRKPGQMEHTIAQKWSARSVEELHNGPGEEREVGTALAERTRERHRPLDPALLSLEVTRPSQQLSELQPQVCSALVRALRSMFWPRRFVPKTHLPVTDAVEVSPRAYTHVAASVNGVYVRSDASSKDVLDSRSDSFVFLLHKNRQLNGVEGAASLVIAQVRMIFTHHHRPREPGADPISATFVECRAFCRPLPPDWGPTDIKPFARTWSVDADNMVDSKVYPITDVIAHVAFVPLLDKPGAAVVKMMI